MENVLSQHTLLNMGTDVLQENIWHHVNKKYIGKAIAELMHELLALPKTLKQEGSLCWFELATDKPEISYRYAAEHRAMDYWHIHPDTLVKVVDGNETEANDALNFFIETQQTFGVEHFTLAHFLRETYNTLYADTCIHAKGRLSADELAEASYQTIEHQMDGHPWATINKGRIGFNLQDYQTFAPESDKIVRLLWVAAHKSRASFQAIEELDFEKVVNQELEDEQLATFRKKLFDMELNPQDYYFIPVHAWQWNNRLIFLFAKDIAEKKLVFMGAGNDQYTPQQSIRTFLNVDHPEKFYVKTAISILNTSIFRGLSPDKLAVAPKITQHMSQWIRNDTFLNACGFQILGEVATVNYRHPHYDQLKGIPYHFHEMLGVIWRESATSYLKEEEKPMTMAALMYVDDAGKPLMASLIEKSGLTPEAWFYAYLNAYFRPLIHCFYKHQLLFSPHGENAIMVMKDYIPQRLIVKDFVEEIHLTTAAHAKLPEELQPIVKTIEDEFVMLFIQSGIFDGVFRYISNIAHTYLGYTEDKFWKQVGSIIKNYQQQHPELKEQFEKFDLFIPEFVRVCINRVRLLTYGYKEDTDIPVPEVVGTLQNPIAVYN